MASLDGDWRAVPRALERFATFGAAGLSEYHNDYVCQVAKHKRTGGKKCVSVIR